MEGRATMLHALNKNHNLDILCVISTTFISNKLLMWYYLNLYMKWPKDKTNQHTYDTNIN